MSNAGLWPRERPRPTDSHAEQKVYDALSRQLPANWTAWHSLRIRTEQRIMGLERPVVIVTDLGKVPDRFDAVRVELVFFDSPNAGGLRAGQ